MTEHRIIYYGQSKIHYELLRKETAVKSESAIDITENTKLSKPSKPRKVLIKVHPDQRVVATAPIDASDMLIHDAMMKRARWIWQSLQEFAKQTDEILPKRYVSGETQFYLGRRYVLKVIVDLEQTVGVKLLSGKLNVIVNQVINNPENPSDSERSIRVKALLEKWYQEKAKLIFAERLDLVLPKASWVMDTPSFRLIAMKKQWGSCSPKGNLILNPHLIKAPKECIDYVILHELCHLKEHNHSERFWRLLTQVMPNYKDLKARLDSMAELYLNE